MSVSRPPVLRVGDEVRLGDAVHAVTGLSGLEVELTNVAGATISVARADLFRDPGFSVVSLRAPLPPQGLLAELSEDVAYQARWWEHHIVEVLTGKPPGAGPSQAASGAGVRPRCHHVAAA